MMKLRLFAVLLCLVAGETRGQTVTNPPGAPPGGSVSTNTVTAINASGVSATDTLANRFNGVTNGAGAWTFAYPVNVLLGQSYQQNGIPILVTNGNSANVGGNGFQTDTLVGVGAGANLPAADYLTTAVGWHALYANTSANTESTAVGWGSQQSSTTGNQNTTLGINTLGTATTAIHDIQIGTDSMRNGTASYNIGIGVTTLINDDAGFNIAIGDATLQSNLSATGTFNIGIGWQTLTGTSLTTGARLIAIGAAIAPGVTTASDDIFIGHQVAKNATVAFQSTIIGSKAGSNMGGNGVNTFLGYSTGYATTSAQQSTLIGASVGLSTFATGSGVIMIGSGKFTVDTPLSTTSNYINIENIITTTGTNTPSTSVTTIAGSLTAPALATSGTVAGSVCQTSAGITLYEAGVNCYAPTGVVSASALSFTGSAPVVSACGTSPSIDSKATNNSGTVTVGTVAAASCTVTFANSGFATWNHCRVTSQTTLAAFGYSYTKTVLTVTGTSLVSDLFDYQCDGS